MHFSSPSGCRFSWCRPWYRGAVGTLTSGYSSVTTLVNIVANVTPKPATGANRSESQPPPPLSVSATEHLLHNGCFRRADALATGRAVGRAVAADHRLTGHRRDRITTG